MTEATRLALADIVQAIESGAVKIDSPNIGGGDPEIGYEPHYWHDEWLHRAKAALRAIPQAPVAKRPFAFAVRRAPENGPDQWRLFMDEEDAREAANQLDGDYEELYRVDDRRSAIAALAPAGWRSRNILGPENCWVFTKDQPQPHPQYIDEPLYAAPIIQSSDGGVEGHARQDRTTGQWPQDGGVKPNNLQTGMEVGIKPGPSDAYAGPVVTHDLMAWYPPSFRSDEIAQAAPSSPSEPIAQGQREAFKPITMQDVRLAIGEGRLSERAMLDACNIVIRQRLAALPQPPVGACREALEETFRALREIKRVVEESGKLNGREYVGLGIRVNNALDRAERALAPSAQEGECPQCKGTGRELHFSEQGFKHEDRPCRACSVTRPDQGGDRG